MSQEASPSEVPISVGSSLVNLYDYVDLRPSKLEGIVPVLDLSMGHLESTYIYLGDKELFNVRPNDTTFGQCIKISPEDATDVEEAERAEFVKYLIPGFNQAKIANTTFVALDLLNITMRAFVTISNKWLRDNGAVLGSTPRPDLFEVEQELCRYSSYVLMHEILHVPYVASIGADREKEESEVEGKLEEIGETDIPSRLVNIRLARRHTLASLATTLEGMLKLRPIPVANQ